ncbi:ATP-binding cassette domain-containing protein [Streptacidiphilus sp. EB129]|uniref:ATP-binding cassette domain-containing protein n=1 Tax=Streptacidiphilus sp. EB129 TaxID=3156262 RepID=UPI003516FB16
MSAAIRVEGLVKTYGGRHPVRALDGVDLDVPEGTVLGLLGPNGAGKTTVVRILAGLLRPDAGQARVLGLDVARDPERVRALIGLSGQYAAVDDTLTARENLVLVGRLHHLGKRNSSARATELLDRFGLTEARDRVVKGFSGGMRRRLDLAAALVAEPAVLFLDEPTTGLDPRSRMDLWDVLAELVASGTTLLLTTQYLEEADRLADAIAVVDHGRVIARGTADELKERVGGERVSVVVRDRARLDAAVAALDGLGLAPPRAEPRTRGITLPVRGGARVLMEALRRLDAVGIELDDAALRKPTLDDVFLGLTGHAARPADANADADAADPDAAATAGSRA